jgi:low affinity Fe/Cu permease
MTTVNAPAGKESIFDRIADYVSAAMGRPTNIMVWLVLVVGWTVAELFIGFLVAAAANRS